MSEQRPVPQQFPSRRQRREQQEPPVAPLSPAPGQPRGTQPPVAPSPGAQPYGAPPRVPQQSALPPQVVSQGVTSAVPPAGFQPLAEPSGAVRPATAQPNRPVSPGVSARPAANPPVPGSPHFSMSGPANHQVPGTANPAVPAFAPVPSRPPAASTRPATPALNPGEPQVNPQSSPKASTRPSERPTASTDPDETAASPKRRRTPVSVLVMSGIGQTMLTVGVVLGLFVVWQLYVTTWQVQGATAAAVQSFQSSTANDATATTEVQRTDPPPSVTIPAVGQTFATLHVPRWDLMVIPIMQGTNEAVLDTGYAGHYTDTQGPGELGNFALAAHRRSYGNSFRRVHELQTGDPLVVETSQAWLVYQVTSTEIVLPSQGDVIYPVPHEAKDTVPHERLMTLTTCHPEYGNTQRFIVYSKFSYWVPRTQGRPFALKGLDAMKQAGQGTAPEGPQDGTGAPASDSNAIAQPGDASPAPAEGLAG
ncbi:class E sortase [Mobiluncus sp.]|uniref:class E sortase n=1 Tax=Mobiluncus sp. TaxID=47293 RepID=UPI002A9151D2|nr:class E sortase [Mobiluncus sp.]MDY6076753.1 class E sortase [Mobiluncus sp.]